MILFSSGRWTTDAKEVEEMIAYKPYREYREEGGWRGGRRIRRAEVDNYLNALADLGVVTMDDVKAFRVWKKNVVNRRYAMERLVKAEKEVAELREEIAAPVLTATP